MKPRRLPEAYEFLPGKFFPRLVYGSERARAFLLCLEAGQGLPARADSEEMVCYVLEGRGKLTVGEEVEVLLGIVNHEYQVMSYRVVIRVDGVKNEEIGPVVLEHEEEWEQAVSFIPEKTGENQEIEFFQINY